MGCSSLLGLSSSYYAFRGKGIYDSVKAVFGLGFEAVELGAAHGFEADSWETVKRIKRDFPGKSYTIHSLFPPPRKRFWFNPSLGMSKQNKRVVDNLFKAAELTEAGVVGIHPGFLNEMGFAFDPTRGFDVIVPKKPLDRGKSIENFYELLHYALRLAGNAGVRLAVENIHAREAMPLVFTIGEFQHMFAAFPELGLLFDYGHALFEDMAAELLESFSSRIAGVHMHWTEKQSEECQLDRHAAVSSQGQIELFRNVAQIKKIPIVFEHGVNVSEGEIKKEKELVEAFLKGF